VALHQVDGAVEDVLVAVLQLRLDRAPRVGVDAVEAQVLLAAVLRVDVPLVDGLGRVGDRVGVVDGILLEAAANNSGRKRCILFILSLVL
jgi:hypothetical protein